MTICFIATCAGCGFAFEPGSTIYTDEIPLCSTCRRNGLADAECETCGEYEVIYEGHGKCAACAPYFPNDDEWPGLHLLVSP